MHVSGSVLAVKGNYKEYAQILKKACVDYIHIDIFQNGGEIGLADLSQFQEDCMPLDLHLIYEEITDWDIEVINQSAVKFLNIQYETLHNKNSIKEISRKITGSFGIALTVDTPLEVIDENIDYISQVLIMCSRPGISGETFNEDNYKRIEQIRDKYPTLKIWVDGGIDNKIAKRLGKHKIDVVVSGSYLCRDIKNICALTYKLKYLDERNIKVTRNMLHLNELPIVEGNSKFAEIIIQMNCYRMGTVLVVDKGELQGLITDGDIRRAIVRYGKNIFEKMAQDFMNKIPLAVDSGWTMEEVFEMLTQKQKRTDFIPVMEDKKLIGALDLHVGR